MSAAEADAALYSICSIPSSLLSEVEQNTESLPKGVLTPVDTADFRSFRRKSFLSSGCDIGVSDAMMDRLFAGDMTVLCLACRRAKVSDSDAGGSGKENARRSRLVPLVMVMTGLSKPEESLPGAGAETTPTTVGNARSAGRMSGDLVGEPPALSRRSLGLGGELYMPAGRGDVKGAEVEDEEAPWSAFRHASEQ